MRPRMQAGWGFGLSWVLATAVGWYVGTLAGTTVGLFSSFALSPNPDFFTVTTAGLVKETPALTSGELVAWAVGGAIAGLIISILQWLVLRRQIRNARWWVLMSIVGMAVTWVVTARASPQDYVILFGVVNGVFQSLVWGRWGWLFVLWIPVTTLAWIAGFGIYSVFGPIVANGTLWGFVPGIVTGIVTGVTLVWLLRRPARGLGHTAKETSSLGTG